MENFQDRVVWIRIVLRGWVRIRFALCAERLAPDPVCPERLAPDPVSLKVGSGSSQYQTGSETLVSSLTTFHFSFYYSVVF